MNAKADTPEPHIPAIELERARSERDPRYELTVGLNVADQEMYAAYRREMLPLLTTTGGFFRFDCEVAQVLKSEEANSINRLFVISFPSRQIATQFFSNPQYVEIRQRLFIHSVAATHIVSEHVTL
jgi:uncharacterized protein (DUF1330 family)